MAEEKKGNLAMVGEFSREAEVLIFVFGNLDIWLKSLDGSWQYAFWPTVGFNQRHLCRGKSFSDCRNVS